MASLATQTALRGRGIDRHAFAVQESESLSITRLQIFTRTPTAKAALSGELAMTLPEPGRVLRNGTAICVSVGPGDFMLLQPREDCSRIQADWQQRTQGMLSALTPLSDGRSVFRLGGSSWREVVARGSTLDFHPTVFTADSSAATRLAGLPVLIVSEPDGAGALLVVCRSAAVWLCEWFEAASLDLVDPA